jgi:hypothetical protein
MAKKRKDNNKGGGNNNAQKNVKKLVQLSLVEALRRKQPPRTLAEQQDDDIQKAVKASLIDSTPTVRDHDLRAAKAASLTINSHSKAFVYLTGDSDEDMGDADPSTNCKSSSSNAFQLVHHTMKSLPHLYNFLLLSYQTHLDKKMSHADLHVQFA